MRNRSLKSVIASQGASIKEVMRLIDYSGLRVAYIVDENNKLIGAVSDGEIRRSILKGKDIKDSVKNIVNSNPIVLNEKDLNNNYLIKKKVKKLLERMPDSRYILVLDKNERPQKIVPYFNLIKQNQNDRNEEGINGKNILVVGGAGYLGSVLVRKLLAHGFKVKVLDVLMFGIEPIEELLGHERFEFLRGDMRNISTLVQALNGVDAVINLAAIVGDPACKNRPDAAIETNYLSNKALAEACKYHQVNRFIYASTCSVYGLMDGEKELDENAPLNPVSLYARSKIQSEEGILNLEDENFVPTILRMSTLYGYSPRMRFDLVVNTMTKTAVVDKKIFVHGNGKQWRPLLHVEDAAEAYIRCLEAPIKKIKGAIFNVGANQQNHQVIHIAQIVKQCIPEAFLVFEGKFSADPRNYLVSFSRIEKYLRYRITHGLEKAILRMKDAIETKEIKNVSDSKYYNVE